jgi:hypothetical protein
MRACGSKSGAKTRPQNCQSLDNVLGKSRFLAQNPIFFARNPIFFTCKPIFLNGFPRFHDSFQFSSKAFQLSPMAFCFPQCLFYFPRRLSTFRKGFLNFLKKIPIFLDGFPLSAKSKKIYLRRQAYKRSLFELRNFSPLCSPSFVIASRLSELPPKQSARK